MPENQSSEETPKTVWAVLSSERNVVHSTGEMHFPTEEEARAYAKRIEHREQILRIYERPPTTPKPETPFSVIKEQIARGKKYGPMIIRAYPYLRTKGR
jgi:hypothetical protein